MTKDETLYEFKKLIIKYTKLKNSCINQMNVLTEGGYNHISEEVSELQGEENAYSEIINDLRDLLDEM